MKNDKKLAAALAAVSAYIKTEEEAILSPPPLKSASQPEMNSAPLVNLWGLSGRQNMMQMRNLMQLKAFNRLN